MNRQRSTPDATARSPRTIDGIPGIQEQVCAGDTFPTAPSAATAGLSQLLGCYFRPVGRKKSARIHQGRSERSLAYHAAGGLQGDALRMCQITVHAALAR